MRYRPPIHTISFRLDKEMFKMLNDIIKVKRMCRSTYIRNALLGRMKTDLTSNTGNGMTLGEEVSFMNGTYDNYGKTYRPYFIDDPELIDGPESSIT